MSDLTIHKFSKDLQQRLARRAARKGRSAEAEAREILREAVQGESQVPNKPMSGKELYAKIRALVEPDGGYELDIPPRHPEPESESKPSSVGK